MSTAVIAVGRMKEKPFRQMADEYLKRLSRFGKFEEIEIPDLPENSGSAAMEEQIRTKEGEALKEKALDIPFKMASCIRLDRQEAAELHRLLYKVMNSF